MIKRKCVQCGKLFTISDSEEAFFKSKNLSVPKRCRQCREKNKTKSGYSPKSQPYSDYGSYKLSRPVSPKSLLVLIISALITICAMTNGFDYKIKLSALAVFLICAFGIFASCFTKKVAVREFDTSHYKHTFYDTRSMVSHYVKHGKQTHSEDMENYLFRANLVITDKGNISKITKDNDTAYYNPKTKELVIVAKAGYIRTYFIANQYYYNKQ